MLGVSARRRRRREAAQAPRSARWGCRSRSASWPPRHRRSAASRVVSSGASRSESASTIDHAVRRESHQRLHGEQRAHVTSTSRPTPTFDCWPAVTVARSTSRSLASPASRRATVIRRRLSASRAVWRDNRKRASAASARVYVVSTSTTAAARSERNCSRAARVRRVRGADARAAQPRRLERECRRMTCPCGVAFE